MKRLALPLLALLALAACAPKPAASATSSETPTPLPSLTVAPAEAPATPSGPATPVKAGKLDASAAFVSDVKWLKSNMGAKVFSVGAPDPEINGLLTYLGVFEGVGGGWRTYLLGNFSDWMIAEDAPGKVVVRVRREWVDPSTHDTRAAWEKLIVDVPTPEAASTLVTPAT